MRVSFDGLITNTGDYRIDFYYESRERMRGGKSLNADSLNQAHEIAKVSMPEGCASYRIARVIFNSLDDGKSKWMADEHE